MPGSGRKAGLITGQMNRKKIPNFIINHTLHFVATIPLLNLHESPSFFLGE